MKFRPHHFMCNLGFKGMGYSNDFINNFKIVNQQLQEDPTTIITIVGHQDTICQTCPQLNSVTGCNDYIKVDNIDQKHLAILDYKIGQTVTWQQAKEQIKLQITEEKFDDICAGCEWQPYGVCLEALKNLRAS